MSLKCREAKNQDQKLLDKSKAKKEVSGSCYGTGAKNQYCKSCDDVLDAFRTKGYPVDSLERFKQCIDEGYLKFGRESCVYWGSIRTPRLKGRSSFLSWKTSGQDNGRCTAFLGSPDRSICPIRSRILNWVRKFLEQSIHLMD
jgi:hypothetical protein